MPCVLDSWLAERCGVERISQEAVRHHQASRIRAMLEYLIQSNAWYRQHLAAVPQSVRRFDSMDDLSCLPFMDASSIPDWRDLLCVSQSEVARMVTLGTSGTTGSPKRLAFSSKDLANIRDFFRVGMSQLVCSGDRLLILLPGAERPNGVADLLRQALYDLGVEVTIPQKPDSPIGEEVRRQQPECLVAAPSQIQRLMAERPSLLSGMRILSSGECLSSELQCNLRELGCLVLDHYGLTESGYGGGVECLEHNGYHLRELDVVLEVVDIHTGSPVPDGQEGELVLTTPGRKAMPLLRYRTGDVGQMLSGPCRCGSPLRRLGPIRGRLVRRGNVVQIEYLKKGGSNHEGNLSYPL